jgi:hypothetical protein
MRAVALILALSLPLSAASPGLQAGPRTTPRSAPKAPSKAAKKPTKEQNFVLQVIQSAVALSQPDLQDRLRVLASASSVAATIAPKYASQIAREGVEVESLLVMNGQMPAVSIMASGRADCAAMKKFVEQLYPRLVQPAEQSLIGAVTRCPQTLLEPVRQKVDAAFEQDILAPRLLLAVMEKSGPKAPWTRERFAKLFSSLPDGASETSKLLAPDYAAIYANVGPKLGEEDLLRSNGRKLLEWLGKMDASSERSIAVSMTTGALEQALGKETYERWLASDVMMKQIVEAKGPPPEISRPPEESASVLRAMGGKGTEQQEDLRKLPPSLRAREAAAHGFARGIAKDRDSANSFFDMAFSAAEETWSRRDSAPNAPAVVQEVCEAAAQVDAIDALRRAQRFQDPTAQALGMIAVARVVAGRDTR